jgi:hypothetical protein
MNFLTSLWKRRGLAAWIVLASQAACGETTNSWPDHQEVLELIRTQLPSLSQDELNRAVIEGLQKNLRTRIQLLAVSNPPSAHDSSGLSATSVFDQFYGYFRVGQITDGLPTAVAKALQEMNSSNTLKGIVIDLRYADGSNYLAAAQVADLFLDEEKPLLSIESNILSSTAKTNNWKQPVAVLINQDTAEAAEVLAGVLREENIALLLGTPTAGQARLFKSYLLHNGQQLRLAAGPVRLGKEKPMPDRGLKPDIVITVPPEEERAYYADAYKIIRKSADVGLVSSGPTNNPSLATVTNRSPRRLNEAELIRRQKEGWDPEGEPIDSVSKEAEITKPTVTDPALARAIDLLKGLAVVQKNRPGTFNR